MLHMFCMAFRMMFIKLFFRAAVLEHIWLALTKPIIHFWLPVVLLFWCPSPCYWLFVLLSRFDVCTHPSQICPLHSFLVILSLTHLLRVSGHDSVTLSDLSDKFEQAWQSSAKNGPALQFPCIQHLRYPCSTKSCRTRQLGVSLAWIRCRLLQLSFYMRRSSFARPFFWAFCGKGKSQDHLWLLCRHFSALWRR